MDHNMRRKNEKVKKINARKVREIFESESKLEKAQVSKSTLRSPKSSKKMTEVKISLPNLENYPNMGICTDEQFNKHIAEYPILTEEINFLRRIKYSSTFGEYKLVDVCIRYLPTKGYFISATVEVPKEEEKQVLEYINSLRTA